MSTAPGIFDDATLSPIARMKLNAELMGLVRDKSAIATTDPMAALKSARVASKIIGVLTSLGLDLKAKTPEPVAVAEPEFSDEPRSPSGKFYEFDPNRKTAQRKRDNVAAMALLARIDAGEIDGENLTDDQKATLAKYSGTGGALIGADGKKGSAYEYYTPKPIAEGMWTLMRELGFAGGKVLDPSAGVGIFGGTAPIDAVVDSVELNETSGRINALVNKGDGYSVEVSSFEKVASATPDEMYDAVITNVPFGSVTDRGGNELGDKRYQKEPLQNYFILRALEKLKPGGLAAFITPPRCMSGKGGKEEDLRTETSFKAEFLGAYRLPNVVFGAASADTITDVIVFRKYSRETALKIEELREQEPARLIAANVLWPEFVGGKYFMGEGKRFVLGEFVPKNPNDFRPVDRVMSDASIPNIAKLLRKFPGSRVDWELLAAAETQPIIYAEGDTVTQKGQTLQFKDGAWVAIVTNEASPAMLTMGGNVGTPMQAFRNGITFKQAAQYLQFMLDTSQALDIPDWLRGAMSQLARLSTEGERARFWSAGVVGMSVAYLLSEHQSEEGGFDYLSEYPDLSDAMKRVAIDAKSCPGSVGGDMKSGMKAIAVHYGKKTGFSGVWSGTYIADADARSNDEKFEGVKYAAKGLWVDRESAKAIYGEDFDPVADNDWCLSDDGKQLAKADDYFIGNYGEMLVKLDAAALAATDPEIKGKLLAQRAEADSRVDRIDITAVSFNLFSPYATLEEKAEFMRRFVSPHFAVAYDEETGKPYIECTIKTAKTSREKLFKRLAQYLKNGTVSLGGAEVGDTRDGMLALREMVSTANEQFNGWCKANPVIMARLHELANDPARLYFKQVEDESPLVIPGLSGNITPHGYQNSFIRAQGRTFGGLNGFNVGLGKTLAALASVAYVQSIGAKKKSAFIVPNSVLSNWRKEAKNIYTSMDDCLFIGLDINAKTGKATVNSSNYDRDLNIVMENRHKKIFMSMEAFERLRLRDETIDGYEAFMRSVDASFAESEDKKRDEAAKGKAKRLVDMLKSGKSASTPYLEDMGIDSIVIDEAHAMKNSADTVEFKSAKFLALAPSAARGLDAQAKAWFIRSKSPLRDGVLGLTATPITNSPLEIYSMLSLVVGRDRVNDMAMGINGADQFMEMMCRVESEEDETVDGIIRDNRIFKGLENVAILRKALGDVAVIKDAESVGQQVKVPDADHVSSAVALPDPPILETLLQYKGAFRYAIDEISGRANNRGDLEAFEAVSAKFGEPAALIGHPFNLINKMSMLIIDPELDERATFYQVSAGQVEVAAAVIDTFNAKKYTEERTRPGPHSAADAVVGQITRKDGEDKITFLKIRVAAKLSGQRIIIDTITPETQSSFEAMAEKAGLELDVTVPPKLAAMIANVIKEETNPRGVDSEGNHTPRVKQLIFCDILPLHNKIKLLLAKRAGIPASSIVIVTGKSNNKADEILAVQDGFNADGADNKYRIVIANKKAEVGINLQVGTQAIHHLTVGWTPDSLTQRDGRGVRQGNKTERVTVYTYDADGTFDSHKRAMVSKKSNWIEQVMDVNGGDSINVEGGMSREQLEALIDTVGDADAMTRLQERLATKEREVRAVGVRAKQTVNIRTVQASNKFLADNADAKAWAARKFVQYYALKSQANDLQNRIDNPKASANSLVKNESVLADVKARVAGLRSALAEAMKVEDKQGARVTIDQMYASFLAAYRGRGEAVADTISDRIMGVRYSDYVITINESSAIANEWQSEVDMTKALIKEAKSAFTKQAKQEGGIPAPVMAAMAEGRGVILDGKPVVDGAFVKTESGQLAVVFESGSKIIGWRADGKSATMMLVSLKSPTVILPGSAEYDDALTEAAKMDDAIAGAGVSISDAEYRMTFSAQIPEVSQRRTTATTVLYSAHDKGLTAPYFAKVIDPADAALGPVMAAIVANQAVVISSYEPGKYNSGHMFTVDSSVEVVKLDRRFAMEGCMRETLAFARANGMRLTFGETINIGPFGAALTYKNVVQFAVKAGGPTIESVLTGTTEAELNAAAAAWVVASMPDMDLTGEDPMKFLDWHAGYALQGAIKKVMTPPQVPVAEAVAQVAAVTSTESVVAIDGPIGDDDMVGVKGNTMTWKDRIKSSATDLKSRAIWDGANEQWNVPFKAWKHLVDKNPLCARPGQLEMVEFSGKSSYKKSK